MTHLRRLIFLALILINGFVITAQVSPWGTGVINNQNIGQLVNPNTVFPSNTEYGVFGTDQVIGAFPHPDSLLNTYTYDIYIPPTYDGTEPYGLITFINSGNNGGLISSWAQVLDEKKLILIAGDNIGNSIYVHIRNGVAWAAVHRLKEVLNIDTNRIYTSGNSGGGRMSTVLAYIYPEWIKGAVPNCGASYLRQVAQDYETQNPNSHYEYTYPFTTAEMNYVQTFDQRMGIMTSYDDFREGDIMNIYHNGMVQDDYKGKFLEVAGAHCTTSSAHFRDAINFIEHPFITVVSDSMDNLPTAIGEGFDLVLANVQNSKMILQHTSSESAQVVSKTPFLWNDPKGSIITTAIQVDTATFNRNTIFDLGIRSFSNTNSYCELTADSLVGGVATILTRVEFNDSLPTLSLIIENPNQAISNMIIFQSEFKDWIEQDTLNIKFHLWGEELRMEFSNHFNTPTTAISGVKMLDDERSVQIKWNDLSAATYWDTLAWNQGALLTMSAKPENNLQAVGKLSIAFLEVITADTAGVNAVPNAANTVSISQSGDSLLATPGRGGYQWYLDGSILVNDTNDYLEINQNGDYHVTIYSNTVCRAASNILTVVSAVLEEEISKSGINIYPNPTSGDIIIDSGEIKASEGFIEMVDLRGVVVYANMMTRVIDISDYPKGIYFLRIKNQNEEKVFKLIKQ